MKFTFINLKNWLTNWGVLIKLFVLAVITFWIISQNQDTCLMAPAIFYIRKWKLYPPQYSFVYKFDTFLFSKIEILRNWSFENYLFEVKHEIPKIQKLIFFMYLQFIKATQTKSMLCKTFDQCRFKKFSKIWFALCLNCLYLSRIEP